MANNPKKVKDPTEVALSAIQEALNIGDALDGRQCGIGAQRRGADDFAVAGYNEPSFDEPRLRHPAERRPADLRTDRRAARDPPRRQ